jgi:hypothetical protein
VGVRDWGGMRRPDLPLLALVLAVGAALAIFAGDDSPPMPQTADQRAVENDITDEFLADAGPALASCLAGNVVPASGGETVPEAPDALVREVSARVEDLRKLEYSRPVDAQFLGPEAMAERLDVLLRRELPRGPVAREGEVLELLGAIPEGSDLAAIERDALSSQVVGLYDPETKELLVELSGSADADELITLAHELEHALADQRLNLALPKGHTAADRALARLAVVEGDATLTMSRYALAELGLAELSALGEGSLPGARAFDELPDYVQRSLLFPYLEGLRLVCYRWLKGGWAAVDRLYTRPPASSDQVMFPVRYGDGPPTDPRDPGRPGPAWRLLAGRELGAAELEWLLSAPGGNRQLALPQPRALAAAWAGGEVELWGRGDQRALGVALAQRPGARTLCGAMAAWEDSAFGAERATALTCDDREVRVGIAPTAGQAQRIASGGDTPNVR